MTKRTLGSGLEHLEDRLALDATGIIDIPAVRLIAEHTQVQLHAELGASVWTSWERHGTSGTGGILRSVGTGAGNPGNPDNPSATDAFILQFNEPIKRPTTVKLWTEGVLPTQVYAWVNSAQWRIDGTADGTIFIDASEENPINNLSILRSGGTGRYGIDYLDIQADLEPDPGEFPDQEEEILPEPATKTFIDIPAVRTIGEHTSIQLMPGLSAEVWTSWERYGTSGTGSILRSIGTGHGNPGNPDNPSATDALVLQFNTPITRPTTLHLWSDVPASLAQAYVWVNSAARRVNSSPDGTVFIDASDQNPITNLSILSSSGGKYGIDSFEIENGPPEELKEGSMRIVSADNHKIQIEYSSTADSTTFDLRKNLASGQSFGAVTVQHPGGIVNGTVELQPNWDTFGNWQVSGMFSVNMKDGATNRKLDRSFAAMSWNGQTISPVNDEPPSIDPESIREYEGEPKIAMESDGRKIFAWFASPYDSSYVEIVQNAYSLEPVQLTGSATVEHPGGTAGGFVQLAIPANIPANATLIARVWDRQFGTLLAEQSFAQNEPIPTENRWDGMPPKTELVESLGNLDGNILNIQEQRLMDESGLVTPVATLEERLHAAYPSIWPADLTAEVERLYQLNPNFTRGHYEQNIINAQHDLLNEAMDDFYDYLDGLAPLIRSATQYWSAAYAGDDVAILDMQLEDDHADLVACQYVDKPSYAALMAAGKKLFLGQQDMFVQHARDTMTWRERQSYLANQGLIVSQSTMDAMTVARQLALNDNPVSFLNHIHGLDSTTRIELARLIGYDLYNGEIPEFDEALFIARPDQLLDGVGGSNERIWSPNAYLTNQGMSLYNPIKNNLLSRLASLDISKLEQTGVGRLFLGVAQAAVEALTNNLPNIAAIIHAATGIETAKVLQVLQSASSPQMRPVVLKEMFAPTVAERGDPALASAFNPGQLESTEIVETWASRPNDRETNQPLDVVRIRFNFTTPTNSYHQGNVYLMDESGQVQLSNIPLLQGNFQHTMWVQIPVSRIADVLRTTFGQGIDVINTEFTFKLALWETANSSQGMQGDRVSNSISLPDVFSATSTNSPGDYSTLPDTSDNAERREKENAVLSILANPAKFPLRSITSGNWYWNIASPYHDGTNQYNAVDITMPGTTDRGQAVRAPAQGTVVPEGDGTNTWHTVILKHESILPSGETFTWFTKYLHMDNVGLRQANGTIIPLTAGMIVPEDAQFGEVNTIGSGVDNDHLHMSGHIDDANGLSIDLRTVLVDAFGLAVKAQDAGPDGSLQQYGDNDSFNVEWDVNLKKFVTTNLQSNGEENPRLILDRSPQNVAGNVPDSQSNQFWIAYAQNPEDRRRVVRDGTTYQWYEVDENGDYVSQNGMMHVWKKNPLTNSFEFIWE